MKTIKILSFVAGLSMLAAAFAPVKVSAASVTLSLTGATNTNGTFSAVVYENSDAARVTTVKIDLGFSGAVSNVSYDYSVGPFSNPTPSGAGATQGYVTGSQPVARVSFKLANTGSVTTSAGSSYLKGTSDDGTQVITHSVSGGSATFTYNAPAVTPTPVATTPSTTAPTTKSSTSTNSSAAKTSATTPSSTDGTVAGDETTTNATASTTDDKKDTKKSDSKKADAKNTSDSSKSWTWALLIAAAALAGFAAARFVRARRAVAAKVSAEKAAAASAAKAKDGKTKSNKK